MSEENPVKRKRGRPRKDTTIVSDAPRRTTRQRARQSHVPIMNVASFGKRAWKNGAFYLLDYLFLRLRESFELIL